VPDYERREDESIHDYVDRTTDELHRQLKSDLDAVFRKFFIVCGAVVAVCFGAVVLLKWLGG
jgi:hypothetical protein